jgi:hypothetical protein
MIKKLMFCSARASAAFLAGAIATFAVVYRVTKEDRSASPGA